MNDFPIFLKCKPNIFADLVDSTMERTMAISSCLLISILSYFFLFSNSAGLVVTMKLEKKRGRTALVKNVFGDAVKLLM